MKFKIREIDYLIVDGDYLAHRAYFASTQMHGTYNTPLKTKTGILSGCFYGFFSALYRKIGDYGPKKIFICWGDSRDNLLRREWSSNYKSNRTTMDDAFYWQLGDIKVALNFMNMIQYWSSRYEADDVIATLCHKFDDNQNSIVILTADKDMLQLVNENIRVVGLAANAKKFDVEFNIEEVKKRYDVEPNLIADLLTLTGDKSDGIIGVNGIGEKTAAKLLNSLGAIKLWINKLDTIDINETIREKLRDNRDLLILNKRLISLKNVNVELHEIPFFTSSNLTSADDVFDKYEMQQIRPEMFLKKS